MMSSGIRQLSLEAIVEEGGSYDSRKYFYLIDLFPSNTLLKECLQDNTGQKSFQSSIYDPFRRIFYSKHGDRFSNQFYNDFLDRLDLFIELINDSNFKSKAVQKFNQIHFFYKYKKYHFLRESVILLVFFLIINSIMTMVFNGRISLPILLFSSITPSLIFALIKVNHQKKSAHILLKELNGVILQKTYYFDLYLSK